MESNPSLCRFFSSIFLLYLKFFFSFLARNVHIQSDIDECGFRKTSSWPASFASSPLGRGRDGGMETVKDGGMEEISQRVIQCIHKLSLDTKSLPFVVELHFFRNRVDFSKWKKLKPKVCNTHNFSVTWKEKAQSVVMQHCFCQASLFSFFFFFLDFLLYSDRCFSSFFPPQCLPLNRIVTAVRGLRHQVSPFIFTESRWPSDLIPPWTGHLLKIQFYYFSCCRWSTRSNVAATL